MSNGSFRRRISGRALQFQSFGGMGKRGGGFQHELNLRRGQAVGLVDEVAEGALKL